MHLFLPFFVTSCFLFLLTGCAPSEAPLPPPNILWINCEDINPNLGAYGDELAVTPRLDQLADEGLVYRNAFATAPICAPSRSCLITGLYATALGTQHLRNDIRLPDHIKAFPEYLKEKGYFVTNYAKTDYNFDPAGIYDYWERDMAPWRQRVRADQPFFSFFVFGMTHEGSVNNTERWARNVEGMPEGRLHDPATQPVPVYHPDTDTMRQCWAHYYDNITVLDRTVGEVLDNLEADGLKDNTIVFFFSDHGAGLPRYKRWLYRTGLHVPLIVYVPEAYRSLMPAPPGEAVDELVSFVDFAPTVLELAGASIPEHIQGRPFLAADRSPARDYIYGARSRADNMYEMARCVSDGRYLYIRHFMPHLPYMQPGIIFSDLKESVAELDRLRAAGLLPPEAEVMYQPKVIEELYDWQSDPQELNNLIDQPEHAAKQEELRARLHEWMRDHHDTGLLHEAEYMLRSSGSTPYEMTHTPEQYDAGRLLSAAERVGTAPVDELTAQLDNADSGVRYWAVIGLQAKGEEGKAAVPALKERLEDDSPVVQIAAAETLCRLGACDEALEVLGRWVLDDRGWLALYAARAVELLGAKAKPLVPTLYQALDKVRSEPGAARRFKNFNFAAFTGWSLEYALINCGEALTVESLM